MNKPRFTKKRFHKMCDMAEVSEQLVADYMNEKSSNSKDFIIVDKATQKAGIKDGWHIPDLTREDGKMVEVKEDFSSAWTGNIAIEKNCLERMLAYCDANDKPYPLLASVNHKEYSVLFFRTEGLLEQLDEMANKNQIWLTKGGDLDEWNYIVNLEFAKSFCAFYDNVNFPKLAKPLLKGRKTPNS
jgi:hypothetical protein